MKKNKLDKRVGILMLVWLVITGLAAVKYLLL